MKDSRESYVVRPCHQEDLDAILDIEKEAFPDPYDRATFSQLLMAEPLGFLVAEGDGHILGYITAVVRSRRAVIYSIAVSVAHMREGIGRQLMVAELRYLSARASTVQLQVSVNNSAARNLYSSFAFVEKGRIDRYYPNGDDAIVMELALRPS
jgi:[ribosomal protein S18]-alanine N-acetyltransferase